MAAETDRLGTLVDDVLVLARADADELRLDVRPIDVERLITQVCDTLAPLARRERNLVAILEDPYERAERGSREYRSAGR